MSNSARNMVMAASAVLVCGLLIAQSLRKAEAQSEGAAQNVIAVAVGSSVRNTIVLFLIDSREQSVMCYDYDVGGGGGLRLKVARTYRYDKSLPDFVNRRDEETPVDRMRMMLEGGPMR
ncbi:MAG TPA: hypothetical protein PL033_18615 [Candidatus Brocadiia bacterium]|nr:hypothetical protein [Candidatus Brocadiia bacterium]